MMRVLDLFSCVGGHALGLHAAGGFETVQFVEKAEDRRAILSSRFPGVPLHDDVRTYHGTAGSADVIVGGPPCQETSVAAAITGKRTGNSLFPYQARICNHVQPEWIIVEQPAGNKAWEAKVASILASIGYHTARFEFAASDVGGLHIRRRVFILANRCLQRLALAWQAGSSEIDLLARSAVARGDWCARVPGTLRVVDGPPYRLDRTPRIEAIGDSNPPIMMQIIGRAILASREAA